MGRRFWLIGKLIARLLPVSARAQALDHREKGGDISAGPEERDDGSVGLVQPLGLEKLGYRTVMEFNDNCNEYRIMLEWRISLCK